MKRLALMVCLSLPLLSVCNQARSRDPAPKVPAVQMKAVVSGNTQFAVELYAKLRDQKGNLFFSPYSISTALAMTSAGARGKTLQQMQDTLHFPAQDKLHPSAAHLITQINGGKDARKRGYQLSTANALWGQKGYPFQADFLTLIKKHYQGGFQQVDFASATEKSRQTINAWVEKQTHDKIKDLLQKGDLDVNTRLVLTNAIYFKGDWNSQFKKDLTRDGIFHTTGGTKVKAPLMFQEGTFGFFQDRSLQILEMPYVGKDLSMVVLLPRQRDGLAQLEKQLNNEKLQGWISKLHKSEVMVTFPRFKMTRRVKLKEVLSKMGMPLAFTGAADFSGLNGGKESLYIGNVFHKAFVAVDEKGTEAAAATAVQVKAESKPIHPVFRADHPFLFLIRDKRSGSILFMGRLNNPS